MKKYIKRICCILCFVLSISALSAQISKIDTITILSFNDFHGSFVPTADQPGAARFVADWKIVYQKAINPIAVCAGDNYSGNYFSRIIKGSALPIMFLDMKVKASSVGNHEFDWGVDMLKDFASKGVPYIAANIFADSLFTVYPDWVKPYEIVKIPSSRKDTLKIAIVGLSTLETTVTTKAENLRGLYFASPVKMAKEYSNRLKDSADLLLLLCHMGSDMKDGQPVWTDETGKALSELFGVDGIITAHSHKKVAGLINGKPIMQAISNGKAIGRMQFKITTKYDSIGGFERECEFLSVNVLPVELQGKSDTATGAYIDRLLTDSIFGFSRILTENVQELEHNREESNKFTGVGTLVTESYANCYRGLMGKKAKKEVVIGVNNFGGIRTGLHKGSITVLAAGNVIPFGGELKAFRLDGKTLKRLFSFGIKNPSGFMQSHGLRISVDANGLVSKIECIKGRSYKEISDTDSCVIIAENFIVSGGDSYPTDCFINEIEEFKNIKADKKDPTDAFINSLGKKKYIEYSEIPVPVCKMP